MDVGSVSATHAPMHDLVVPIGSWASSVGWWQGRIFIDTTGKLRIDMTACSKGGTVPFNFTYIANQ